ncbi:hypothetical protein CPJCM30710_31890 [Clostridium polyendosporum]|uniref:Uncharacterized protein n=1 Tax=Clostridium polyendosporum TaxID=69208 RepID=A0A919S3G8_9CLOT|nr:hypothetical protein [Clostridium polyendosporum]GIM30523.1 hypothetical protein CPJCM30710_31890 [Clostridium polyendosporum]
MYLLDVLYYKFHKCMIDKAILKLKKIQIDMVFEILTKQCWKYGIQYEIIIKDKLELEIKLIGKREVVFLKFHKTLVVFKEDYNKFSNLAETLGADKAFYITTGVFQAEVYKLNQWKLFEPRVVLEDNFHFIKKQLWMKRMYNENLKYKKLQFYRYLPI